jgi:hypothetical protein
MKLIYLGNRKRDITLEGAVTGKKYYFDVSKGEITVDKADAPALLATDQWKEVEPEPVEVQALPEEVSAEGEPPASTRKRN